MVYNKPSTGCRTCRKRGIKCDEQRPSCGQCLKSRRECTGFRDANELLFRNQTVVTTKKGKACRPVVSPVEMPKSITEPVENQALCAFFADFVFPTYQRPEVQSSLDLLTPIYINAKPESALFPVVLAVAFANLSRKPERRMLDARAKQLYCFAVNSVKGALAHPVRSQGDDTLLAIHLLSLYEGITATTESINSWGSHAAGAAALANYRVDDMQRTQTSRSMYWIICGLFLIRNTLHCWPMEPFRTFEDISSTTVRPQVPTESKGDKLTFISMKIPFLRSIAAKVMGLPMDADVAAQIRELLRHAKMVDQELMSWSFDLSTSWRVKRVGYAPNTNGPIEEADCYPGPIDAYYNMWTIILNCIERLVSPTQYQTTRDYRTALNVLRNMVDEICASVPFHLKDQGMFYEYADKFDNSQWDPNLRTYSSPPGMTGNMHNFKNSQTIGAYILSYTLYIAYSVVCIPQHQKDWIKGRFEVVNKLYNLGGAAVLLIRGMDAQVRGRSPSATDMAPPPYVTYEDVLRSPSVDDASRPHDLTQGATVDPDGLIAMIPKHSEKDLTPEKPSQLYSMSVGAHP